MITATVSNHRVEILDIYEYANRKWVQVKDLRGQTFCHWTHGGWAYSNTTNVPIEFLKDIAIPIDLSSQVRLDQFNT